MLRLFIFLLLFILVLGSLDYILFKSFRYLWSGWSAPAKSIIRIVWWSYLPLLILLFLTFRVLPSGFRNITSNIFVILLIAKFIALIVVGLTEAGYFLADLRKAPADQATIISRKIFIGRLSGSIAMIPVVTMIYGIFKTAFDFKIHRVKVNAANLPVEFDGLKIVQISDIHTGTLVNPEQLQKAVDLIHSLEPDLILFTGDLVNNRTDEAYPYKPILQQLRAPMGVFSVLGNHDYGDYYQWNTENDKVQNFKDMIQLHADLGWQLLMNRNVIFHRGSASIALIGVENWGNALRFPRYGKLDVATKGTEEIAYNILMSHDPSHWDAQVNRYYKNIDLTLSGHTHGFQFGVEIPGFKWSPSQYVYKQWAGVYTEGNQVINVNRGLGCIGYMGRVGIRPEISLITLSKGSDSIS